MISNDPIIPELPIGGAPKSSLVPNPRVSTKAGPLGLGFDGHVGLVPI